MPADHNQNSQSLVFTQALWGLASTAQQTAMLQNNTYAIFNVATAAPAIILPGAQPQVCAYAACKMSLGYSARTV